jgi:hypothetical protein
MDLKKHAALRLLGSTVVTIVLLLLFAVAIAAATFIEARVGTAGAWQIVYDALWFEGLLGLLVVNLVVSLLIHMPYRAAQTGVVITHVAFIIVILSAGVTRYLGFEGIVHIREGSSANFMYSDSDYVQLSSGDAIAAVPARFSRQGEVALRRDVKLNGADYRLAVAEYWPHFQQWIVDQPGGVPAVQLILAAAHGREQRTLWLGETVHTEGVTVRFLEHAPSDDEVAFTHRFGELAYMLAGHPHTLTVPEKLPAEVEQDGYTIRIIEFTPDFKVGGVGAHAEELRNPAIRIALRAPDGTEGERLLFAFHPEFRSPQDNPAFDHLHLSYRLGARIDLYPVAGGLEGVTNVHLAAASQGSGSVDRSIESGETFALERGVTIGSGAFAMQLAQYWESAVETAGPSDDESQPAALRLTVEDRSGQRAEVVVPKGVEPSAVRLGERELAVEFGPQRIPLPYTLHLDDFLLVNYPGSENPASYESHVRLHDEERGVHDRPARIYMNHPLTYRGYKHFQSSYDTDRRGTVLSVNYDPGKWPTYFGYTLMGLGFLITLTRGILWMRVPRPRSSR